MAHPLTESEKLQACALWDELQENPRRAHANLMGAPDKVREAIMAELLEAMTRRQQTGKAAPEGETNPFQ
ncbi:hypothetical protein EON80_23895 [bacterium]|nr:MAG: hypothetical protein EON80_23895 [bacterium]